MDFTTLLATLTTLVSAVLYSTEGISLFLKQKMKISVSGWKAVLLSFALSLGLSLALAFLAPAQFESYPFAVWYLQGLLYGVVVFLLSNGAFKLDFVKSILVFLKARKL